MGSVLCLSALLEAPTDTELQNSFGNTALTLAAANNHEAVVRRLLEAGAHPEHLNVSDGCTCRIIERSDRELFAARWINASADGRALRSGVHYKG